MRLVGLVLALVVALASCTSDEPAASVEPSASPTTSAASDPPATTEPSATTEPPDEPEPRPFSLPALFERELTGGRVRVVADVGDYGAYTRHEVRYRSGDLTVSGVLHLPAGRGPFPAVVLAHGYIEPSIYVTGQGMSREMDYLARTGYVVLHADYRGHAGSDQGTLLSRELRLGYTEDVLNAVAAVQRLPYVDAGRVGLMGRSMGGGVTYNALVAKPGLVDAAVVYAPVSSRHVDNFNRWTRPERSGTARLVLDRFGSPRESPAFWRGVSARTYFDRITVPVLMHHGTADESCPLRWSRESYRALREAGVQARLLVYPGEPHAFVAAWERSIRRSVAFLDRHLR